MLAKSDPNFKAWCLLFDDWLLFDFKYRYKIKKRYLPVVHALREFYASYRTKMIRFDDCVWKECETCAVKTQCDMFCGEANVKEWNSAAKRAYKAEYNRLMSKGQIK